jgi:hypothetical protein
MIAQRARVDVTAPDRGAKLTSTQAVPLVDVDGDIHG